VASGDIEVWAQNGMTASATSSPQLTWRSVVLPGGRLVRFTRDDVDAMIAASRDRPAERSDHRPSRARRRRTPAGEQTALRF